MNHSHSLHINEQLHNDLLLTDFLSFLFRRSVVVRFPRCLYLLWVVRRLRGRINYLDRFQCGTSVFSVIVVVYRVIWLCQMNNTQTRLTVRGKRVDESLFTRKPSCRWQTRATLAKSSHGLRKSSGVVSCIARLPIDSLPMVSYYVLYSNCL